ncbi:HTH domain-containing protein [Actinomyces trachealis]|uniref:HTH domain-containing protein n=1 Tax=Actinomyces trachealis TaxID=2763540 RepID=UPI002E2ACB77|nr:HTH domain-containing protein [Actinomyces trachealis]
MDAESRRNHIRRRLEPSAKPLSAGRLGQDLSVSRQVIVSDIALLRAAGPPCWPPTAATCWPAHTIEARLGELGFLWQDQTR